MKSSSVRESKKEEFEIPEEVTAVGRALFDEKFEAYLVGGCVRDLLIGRDPKDWDIATNATPEEIQKVFPESVYENQFGTVGVKTGSENPKFAIVEVTTYRIEGKYTDKRHPDDVKFAKKIEDDLARRDFTINAMALSLADYKLSATSYKLVDPYGGQADIEAQSIRTVGDAEARFNEDALRMMRAVRFSAELDFQIEMNTRRAVEKLAGLLEAISKERVRDELMKILMTRNATRGIITLEELDLLRYVLPELREGLGVEQNLHHIYTVFEHNVRALDYAAKENYSLVVRTASLLHDVGKPKSKRGEGHNSTFYGHEVIGARLALAALDRLHFPKDFIEKVVHLVRCHMFYYNVGEVSEAGVRRFLARVGPEYVDDLIKVREADRIGSGVPKAAPYKLRHLLFMIEKVKRDPISPKMLAVDGSDVMEIAKIEPSPKVGQILGVLLEEVLDNPEVNTKEYLEKRIKALAKFSEKELVKMAEKAKETKEEFEGGVEDEMKEKFHVK